MKLPALSIVLAATAVQAVTVESSLLAADSSAEARLKAEKEKSSSWGMMKFLCFPTGSTVRLADGSTKNIEQLGTGDVLETSEDLQGIARDDPWIFDWHGHLGEEQAVVEAAFLELVHEQGTLRISDNHLLFARKPEDSTAAVLLAEKVEVGDELLVRGKGLGPRSQPSLHPSKVLEIREVKAAGSYAPVTGSGRLVVDDVLVSSYAVVPELPYWKMVMDHVTSAESRAFLESATHKALAPIRLGHQLGRVSSEVLSRGREAFRPADKAGLLAMETLLAGLMTQSEL